MVGNIVSNEKPKLNLSSDVQRPYCGCQKSLRRLEAARIM